MTGRAAPAPAVVLGGAETALSVARSLGGVGVPVTILSDGATNCLARRSRFCHRYVHFVSGPSGDIKALWLDWLVHHEAAVVLPCSDEGVELVARHRTELVEAGHRPIEAADDVLLTMLDKQATYRLAAQIGVRAPRTATAHSREEAQLALEEGLTFPCAVKPTRSDMFVRLRPEYKTPKGTVVHNQDELDATLDILISAGVGALVTEIVPGGDDRFCSYYSYLDDTGEPLVHFTKRKLRQHPIAFGLGTYHMTKWQPDVAALGLKFFQGVGLRGLGNVEFKRDERDGELTLIECNARFTMANGLASLAGIDFALLAYNRLVGLGDPPLESFRDDVCMWFPPQDIRALRAYRAAGTLTTSEWLRTLAHVQHFPTFQWSDPVPSAVGALAAVRKIRAQRRSARTRPVPASTGPAPGHP
jgi:predicted ATP-grasp superfamily ATP-dependent carboligase